MTAETLITCENVSKRFCRDLKKSLYYGARESLAELFGRGTHDSSSCAGDVPLRDSEFWAVKDVSFSVQRGQCLGLLGRNGAGKTTLLKMINGLIRPDAGKITIRGNVSGLIALGAGFNPILTGRENILVNGSILGLSRRDIEERMETILEFAEIGDAIDAPVRTYSSGMQVRLGFSSAVNLIAPDVLLLDEVLAVGDLGFVIKCLNRMRDLASRSAVIFVSHSMQFVSMFCSHGVLMQSGQVVQFSDDLPVIVEGYNQLFTPGAHHSGSGEAEIETQELVRSNGEAATHISIQHGEQLQLRMRVRTSRRATVEVYLHTMAMIPVVASRLLNSDSQPIEISPGTHEFLVNMGRIDLNAGRYLLMVVVNDLNTQKALVRVEGAATVTVRNHRVDWGMISRDFQATCNRVENLTSLQSSHP